MCFSCDTDFGQSRYNQIVSMIERSEQLKSTTEAELQGWLTNWSIYLFGKSGELDSD